ncbi:MAG: hypothetical protein INQ03_03415 [Candidatus Heimdallarchaeota archaeon]|nr:hypothetical protein [Candidatus Heimdallarchaeota archaeon]
MLMFKDKLSFMIDQYKEELTQLSLADGYISNDEMNILMLVSDRMEELSKIATEQPTVPELMKMDIIVKRMAMNTMNIANADFQISSDEQALLLKTRNYVMSISNLITTELKTM